MSDDLDALIIGLISAVQKLDPDATFPGKFHEMDLAAANIRAYVDNLNIKMGSLIQENISARKHILDLESDKAVLGSALAKYADHRNWDCSRSVRGDHYDDHDLWAKDWGDGWEIAEKAIKMGGGE